MKKLLFYIAVVLSITSFQIKSMDLDYLKKNFSSMQEFASKKGHHLFFGFAAMSLISGLIDVNSSSPEQPNNLHAPAINDGPTFAQLAIQTVGAQRHVNNISLIQKSLSSISKKKLFGAGKIGLAYLLLVAGYLHKIANK